MLHPEFSRYALVTTAAALLVALAPVTAQADDALIQKSVTVPVSDLDLSRPADARTLNARIRRAAEQVCGDGLSAAAPTYSPPDRDCVLNAVTQAVKSLKRRPGA